MKIPGSAQQHKRETPTHPHPIEAFAPLGEKWEKNGELSLALGAAGSSSLTLRNSTRVSGPRNHDMAHRGCKSTGVPPA